MNPINRVGLSKSLWCNYDYLAVVGGFRELVYGDR